MCIRMMRDGKRRTLYKEMERGKRRLEVKLGEGDLQDKRAEE
jgi:hypothetical protein